MNIIDNREDGKDTLEQAKFVMLRLLRVFDDICQKHQLRYWLDGGTLIGAIRHNGFIPWDDDIDVAMLRDDLKIFLEIAAKELPEDIFLQTQKTDSRYVLYLTKLRDKYSTYREENNEKLNCHKGIFIDIFPMDFIKHHRLQAILKLFIHGTNYSKLTKVERFIQSFIGRPVRKFVTYFHLPLYDVLNNLFHTTVEDAECLAYTMELNETKQFPKDIFPLQTHKFEGYEFFIPNNYDSYLKSYFGNYMELPPVEERQTHNIGIDPFKPCNHKEVLVWKPQKSQTY